METAGKRRLSRRFFSGFPSEFRAAGLERAGGGVLLAASAGCEGHPRLPPRELPPRHPAQEPAPGHRSGPKVDVSALFRCGFHDFPTVLELFGQRFASISLCAVGGTRLRNVNKLFPLTIDEEWRVFSNLRPLSAMACRWPALGTSRSWWRSRSSTRPRSSPRARTSGSSLSWCLYCNPSRRSGT